MAVPRGVPSTLTGSDPGQPMRCGRCNDASNQREMECTNAGMTMTIDECERVYLWIGHGSFNPFVPDI